jgi:hypothetical protein
VRCLPSLPSMEPSLPTLPDDVLGVISSFLDVLSVLSLCAVSRDLRSSGLKQRVADPARGILSRFHHDPGAGVRGLVHLSLLSTSPLALADFAFHARGKLPARAVGQLLFDPGDRDLESRRARSLALVSRYLALFDFAGMSPVASYRSVLRRTRLPTGPRDAKTLLRRVSARYVECQRGLGDGGGRDTGSSSSSSSSPSSSLPSSPPSRASEELLHVTGWGVLWGRDWGLVEFEVPQAEAATRMREGPDGPAAHRSGGVLVVPPTGPQPATPLALRRIHGYDVREMDEGAVYALLCACVTLNADMRSKKGSGGGGGGGAPSEFAEHCRATTPALAAVPARFLEGTWAELALKGLPVTDGADVRPLKGWAVGEWEGGGQQQQQQLQPAQALARLAAAAAASGKGSREGVREGRRSSSLVGRVRGWWGKKG